MYILQYKLEEEPLKPLTELEEDLEIVLYERIFQVERNRIDSTNPDEDAIAIATSVAANPGVVEYIPNSKQPIIVNEDNKDMP